MLTYEAPLFRVRLKGKIAFRDKEALPSKPKATELARTLALGHRVVWAVEQGNVRTFAEAGRRMGLHQERVSVLVTLTFLAPDIQEAILMGQLKPKGRATQLLLRLAREPRWEVQRRVLEASQGPRECLGQNLSDA